MFAFLALLKLSIEVDVTIILKVTYYILKWCHSLEIDLMNKNRNGETDDFVFFYIESIHFSPISYIFASVFAVCVHMCSCVRMVCVVLTFVPTGIAHLKCKA